MGAMRRIRAPNSQFAILPIRPNQGKPKFRNENETPPEMVWVGGRSILKSVLSDQIKTEAKSAAEKGRGDAINPRFAICNPSNPTKSRLRTNLTPAPAVPAKRSKKVAKPPADPTK